MTDLLTEDPNDTGEIKRIDDLGTEPTRDLRRHVEDSEKTQRLDPRLIQAPTFDAIPRRVFEMDDTVTYMPATIGVVGLEGPQKPPPPLPPQPDDQAAAQPIAPWDRVAGAFQATPDGELHPSSPLRRSVPYVIPADSRPWTGPRHRRQPSYGRGFLQLAIVVVLAMGIALAVTW